MNVQTDAELYTDYNMVVVTGGRHDRQILLTRRESCTHPSSRHAHTSLVVLFHLTMFPCSQLSRRGGGGGLFVFNANSRAQQNAPFHCKPLTPLLLHLIVLRIRIRAVIPDPDLDHESKISSDRVNHF